MLVDRGPFKRVALKSYISRMSKAEPNALFDNHVASILEQQGFLWEEDPRSIYEPEQLYTALKRYATDWTQFEKLDAALTAGFRKAYKIFAKPKEEFCLKPLSNNQVVSQALKLSKSSGLPMMATKAESLTYSFDREQQVRDGLKAPNPCVAYKRTQQGNKSRLVWGYPLEMTIMEARFARPLIQRFLNADTPMAFGMTKMELGAKIHRYFVDAPGTTVCLDFSKYDSTLSAVMIRQAFRILSTWFREEDLNSLGWKTLVEYFISTPIVMPDGHLYTGKRHGVPSGSYFTQMVDSICNVALMYALKYRCGMQFNPRALYVLGDDVIVQVKGQVNLRKWAAYLKSCGLVLHDDEKTVVGQPHFLGAFWFKGKPDVPIQTLVNKAVFPEKFRNYEGKPRTGAEDVLRSYASSYVSAYRLLPMAPASIRSIDMPRSDEVVASKYMSGSEKFIFEEKYNSLQSKSALGPPALAVRLLC